MIGDYDVRLVEDDFAEGEDPKRHHEKGGEGRKGRHRDRQVQVTPQHQRPSVRVIKLFPTHAPS